MALLSQEKENLLKSSGSTHVSDCHTYFANSSAHYLHNVFKNLTTLTQILRMKVISIVTRGNGVWIHVFLLTCLTLEISLPRDSYLTARLVLNGGCIDLGRGQTDRPRVRDDVPELETVEFCSVSLICNSKFLSEL